MEFRFEIVHGAVWCASSYCHGDAKSNRSGGGTGSCYAWRLLLATDLVFCTHVCTRVYRTHYVLRSRPPALFIFIFLRELCCCLVLGYVGRRTDRYRRTRDDDMLKLTSPPFPGGRKPCHQRRSLRTLRVKGRESTWKKAEVSDTTLHPRSP